MQFEKPKDVRAAVMVKPGHMEIRSYPYPSIDDDSAIVKMEMSGICGTDKHLYKGETTQPLGDTPFPILNGHENVGTIVEIGKNAAKNLEGDCKELKVGDRITVGVEVNCGECWFCRNQWDAVACNNQDFAYGCWPTCDEPPHIRGGWSEYMYIGPKSKVFKIPENMSNELAMLTEEMAVAHISLNKAMRSYPIIKDGFGLGDSVAVIGNGPLGLLHGMMARILGADRMIATDLADRRLEMAKTCYADFTINASETTPEERAQKIRDLTEGRGVDLAIETAGTPQGFVEALEVVRRGGTVLELGNWVYVEDAHINVMRLITMKNLHIHGLMSCGLKWGPVIELLNRYSDRYPFEKIISHQMSLDEVVKNMDIVIDPNKTTKVVVVPHK